MLRRLSIGLLASAVAIAPMPLKAQDGSAEDLGDVMSISLKDVVKPTFGFQGALQGAGTPNQAGLVGSCLSLLATTAFGFLMSSLTLISLITKTTAASSIPMWLERPSALQLVLVIAG